MSENEASLTSVSLQLSLPQEVKVVYILPSGLNLGKREREGSIGRGREGREGREGKRGRGGERRRGGRWGQ